MPAAAITSESSLKTTRSPSPSTIRHYRATSAAYVIALASAILLWLIALRAPLSEDETGSVWQVSGGFSQIWHRQYICFPTYSYMLWFSTKLLGISEIALRVPSILAMLVAAYLLYRVAREMFDRELAMIATVLFCLNPIVVFAAIDVRPYAFAVLVTNAVILILLRLRRSHSRRLAALFGALAGLIVWFHYLFATILPGLVIAFWIVRRRTCKACWQQFGIAACAFVVMFLPVLPGLKFLFRTRTSHVFEKPPGLRTLFWTLVPGWAGPVLIGTALLAMIMVGMRRRPNRQFHIQRWQIAACASVALIPILILFGVSTETSIRLFVERHRLVAVPGIVLCWALIISRLRYGSARLAFCLVLVGLTAHQHLTIPDAREHMFSWKSAVRVVEKDASEDGAPVLICSDFPEADYLPIPDPAATKESLLFAPLSYYKLTVPVFGLPRALNNEAMLRSSTFVRSAERRHQRFLAVAFTPSYPTLDWISHLASGGYNVHRLGIYDGIKVLEFDPLPRTNDSR
jgi:Dolichyl-phosphate-mannose-protein mannosyltransferase